jgi:hypothetical protein
LFVLRGLFDVVNDENLHGSFGGLDLQAELFAQGAIEWGLGVGVVGGAVAVPAVFVFQDEVVF